MTNRLLTTAAAFVALASTSPATPSGLNNIPTADTTPQGTFVLQGFTTLGSDRDADLNLGFKSGLNLGPAKLEFGFAWHILPDESGPLVPHGKLALPLGEGLPTIAVGLANITFSRDDRTRAGDEFGYAVVTHDFGWFRAHGGCATQDGDALPFFGVDKTFRREVVKASDGKSVEGGKGTVATESEWRDLFMIRADAIAQRDSSWLYSAGVLIPVTDWFVFEGWGNFPDNGEEASVTLKGNFVFKF